MRAVVDRADKPSLQLTFAVAATSRRVTPLPWLLGLVLRAGDRKVTPTMLAIPLLRCFGSFSVP